MALFQRKSREYMAMPVQKPRARTDDLVTEEVDDELLIYDSTNKRAHALGATAARVWRACDGYSDVSALSEALELDAEVVSQALDELEALELLESQELNVVQAGSGNGDSGNGDGLTRRQLARRSAKVGAGLAAAPLVYSINVSSAMALATPTPFQCALFTTQSCGTSTACGFIAGCCCCCQGGGDCKTCGSVQLCEAGKQPCSPVQGGGFGSMCSTVGSLPASPRGCCAIPGSMQCGCGFGPGANCCHLSDGKACAPSAKDQDCVPCCAGGEIASTLGVAVLGCCTSTTVNCCSDPAPACCANSTITNDCCAAKPPACCATDTCM